MFSYPREFVERVEQEYADWPEIVELARQGKYTLGRFLQEGAIMRISPEEIVAALESGNCTAVRHEAEAAVRRRNLHADWIRNMIDEIKSARAKKSSRWSRPPISRRTISPHPPSLIRPLTLSPPELVAGE